jgi:hypothetical protein
MSMLYSGEGPTALLLPHFVKSKTARGLQRACLDNNLRLKAYVNYFDIQYVEAEKTWYAWYYLAIDIRRSDGPSTLTEG